MFSIQQCPQFINLILNGRKPHPKSKFTPAEDEKLRLIVQEVGEKSWDIVSKRMGTRNQRQCKERWFNYLSPNVKFLPWTFEEDQKLERLHSEYGAKWVKIAQFFPSRTDTNIKNRWMVLQRQKKRLEKKAIQQQELQFSYNHESETKSNTPPVEDLAQPDKTCNQSQNLHIFDSKEDEIDDFKIFDEPLNLTPIDIMTDQCFDFFF